MSTSTSPTSFLPDGVFLMVQGEEEDGVLKEKDLIRVANSLLLLAQHTQSEASLTIFHGVDEGAFLTAAQIVKILSSDRQIFIETRSVNFLNPGCLVSSHALKPSIEKAGGSRPENCVIFLCHPEQIVSLLGEDFPEVPIGAIIGNELKIGMVFDE